MVVRSITLEREREGHSGVTGPCIASEADADRPRPAIAWLSSVDALTAKACSIAGGAACGRIAESLILLRKPCLCGVTGVLKGKLVEKSLNLISSGKGGWRKCQALALLLETVITHTMGFSRSGVRFATE